MNKELGRKITSLTLMTIMLAGSVAFAIPGAMPEAYAENQHLYVSAESAGSFAKGQVIEIVVSEPAISTLDDAHGQPDVSINGSSIVMAQAVDGAWYAYVVDADNSNNLDANYAARTGIGKGGDYGALCGPSTDLTYKNNDEAVSGLAASETQGVWLPNRLGTATPADGTSGYSQGDSITTCTITANQHTLGVSAGQNATTNSNMNVVREFPNLSNGTTANEYGNIKLGANLWPMIQLLDFSSDGMVDIVYNRAGADESVSLEYTDGAEGLSFDKDIYGLKHEIGMTLTDWNLNIDPTDEDSWTFGTLPTNQTVSYQLFDENGAVDASQVPAVSGETVIGLKTYTTANVGDIAPGGTLSIDRNGDSITSDATTDAVINFQGNADVTLKGSCSSGICGVINILAADQPVTLTEAGANTGVFINWDEALKTNMIISDDAKRGTQAVVTYDGTEYGVLHKPAFATINFETDGIGSEWNSGERVSVMVDDADMNFDNRTEDEMKVYSQFTIVPAIKIGSPITLKTLSILNHLPTTGANVVLDNDLETVCSSDYSSTADSAQYVSCYEKYSERSIITIENNPSAFAADDRLVFVHSADTTVGTLTDLISNANGTAAYTYLQYDFRGLNGGSDNLSFTANVTFGDDSLVDGGQGDVAYYGTTVATEPGSETLNTGTSAAMSGLVGNVIINSPGWKLYGTSSLTSSDELRMQISFKTVGTLDLAVADVTPLSADVVTWGQSNDGTLSSDRHNNAIYRVEVEESANGNDSGLFDAEIEYIMLNQLNVNNTGTYNNTVPYGDNIEMIIHNDSTDEDEVRISYLDFGADGVETQVSDQLAAPTHSGVVEFDSDSYKEADTVTVTLTDSDLNTSPDLVNIYTVVNANYDPAHDMVGKSGYGENSESAANGRMLDITIDDELWLDSNDSTKVCSTTVTSGVVDGLYNSGFTLVETGIDTGVFTGDFQIPSEYGARTSGTCAVAKTLGKDLEVNYVDYRDASGEIIEVGDGAGIRANTGSVSLDRTVYPVPFGEKDNFTEETSKKTPNNRSIFPIHSTGISGSYLDASTETLGSGDLTIHIRVDDPDYDVSATGEDQIAENTTSASNRGPLKIYVSRGSEAVTLATAGADVPLQRWCYHSNDNS